LTGFFDPFFENKPQEVKVSSRGKPAKICLKKDLGLSENKSPYRFSF
jgi:hypothetical protein